MLTEIKCDITSINFGVIVNGTNCSGGFGSGLAGVIKRKWPLVAEEYYKLVKGKNLTLLGTCQLVEVESNILYVANCFSQKFYGRDGGKYADIDAIHTSVREAFVHASNYNLPIFLPKIGCGLGGLQWSNEVKPIIENISTEFFEVESYICILK